MLNYLIRDSKSNFSCVICKYKIRIILFFVILSIYAIMAGHYRLEAIDDAWSLSFAWNYTHGIATDPSFRFDTTPIIFGKTHAPR